RGRSVRIFWREGEPVDVEQPFRLQVQSLARGHQQGEMRRVLEDGGYQIDAIKQVLEVVENEQHVQLAQVSQQVSGQIWLPTEIGVQALADRRDDLVGCADGGQRHERDTIGEGTALMRSDLERQARFADPTRPEQREEVTGRIGQQSRDRGQVVVT